MADQNIQIGIQTDLGNTGQTFADLRASFREAKDTLASLPKGTAEWSAALADAAEQYGKIREINRDIKALDPNERFKLIATSVKGLTGGIEAAAGALALFTGKDEELEKTIKQVQSLALIFNGVQEFLTTLRRVPEIIAMFTTYLQANTAAQTANKVAMEGSAVALEGEAVAAETAEVATKGFNTALAAGAIGAILLLLPLLVSGFNDTAKATKDSEEATKVLNEAHKKAIDGLSDEYTHVNLLIEEYKNENTTKKEKKAIQDELQTDYPNYFKNLDSEHDKVGALEEDYAKWSKAIFLKAQTDADAALIQQKTQELLKKQLNPEETLSIWQKIQGVVVTAFNGVGSGLANVTNSAINNVKELTQETKVDIETLTKDYLSKTQEIDKLGGDPTKQSSEKAKKEKVEKNKDAEELLKIEREFRAKLLEEYMKYQEAYDKAAETFFNKGEDADKNKRNKELAEVDRQYKDLLDRAMIAGRDTTALTTAYNEQKIAINKKFDEQEQDAKLKDAKEFNTKVIAANKQANDALLANDKLSYKEKKAALDQSDADILQNYKRGNINEDAFTQEKAQNVEARKALDKAQADSVQSTVDAIGNSLNTLAGIIDQNSVAGKAIAISQAIINTLVGVTKSLATGGILGIAEGAIVLAAGIATVSKIISTKVGNSDSAGGSTSALSSAGSNIGGYSAPQIGTTTQTTNLSQDSVDRVAAANRNQQPIMAYTVESQVTATQQRIAGYQSASTLGGK